MFRIIRHLRHRPSLISGTLVAVLAFGLASAATRPVTAVLIGWNLGILAYGAMLLHVIRRTTTEQLGQVAGDFDEGSWGVLLITILASLASLGAIVVELAQVHGHPHAAWLEALAGCTVLLSWFFIHTVFATHYAHVYWRKASGLNFPGNDRPNYSEFLYFSFCMAVASQVSDVTTESAPMRKLVLAHSLLAYLCNTAIIALGVNIAASLA